jgi:CRISPR-associated endonuclease/helicase Cas3
MTFDNFFEKATDRPPFPFQRGFAEAPVLPQLVRVPTGLGKTAMAVLGWLWRRRFPPNEAIRKATPRRLVYCLPMRVLVEQTRECTQEWLKKLELHDAIRVHLLMGGEETEAWDIYPKQEAILIGTQDMLLSRLLNRGYAASRARWPIQFGLLNTDCLWVFDEIQLMGSGLATTTQMEAFRRRLGNQDGHGCQSVWMSATMQKDWLKTVDFAPFLDETEEFTFDFEKEIKTDELNEKARKVLEDRWNAKKQLTKAESAIGDRAGLVKEVCQAHKPGTRTIVVLNTVKRACELFKALNNRFGGKPCDSKPTIVLLHSRFRPEDRKRQVDQALAKIAPDSPGTLVVSTQVIEAGVDVSATTLFTELAPWASLVQRFGRCNRTGEENEQAAIRWIDLPSTKQEETARPYSLADLQFAHEKIRKLADVGLQFLPDVPLHFEHTHVIRRKDLIDLFDTTHDLAGNDIDIDRFVREVEESDVRVFWRAWDRPKGNEAPPDDEPTPSRAELCPAPIGEFRDFVKKKAGQIWRWNFLDGKWEKATDEKIAPGQVFLVHASAGGYLADRGWCPDSTTPVDWVVPQAETKDREEENTDADPLSRIGVWQTIAEHTDDICNELSCLLETLSLTADQAEALDHAARWHDRGKAHEIFQAALPSGAPDPLKFWAKASKEQSQWKRYTRRHFRHELASALAVLMSPDHLISKGQRDLVAYLVAAHHGKVRLSIRSLPNEKRPDGNRRFARGVWDGDPLPETDLGGGVVAPATTLSLEPMEMGLCEQLPFEGQPSWAERMLGLRDDLGPFRLAYLEAILRAADMRASGKAERQGDSLGGCT